MGPQGPPGPQGVPGFNGTEGATGATGAPGEKTFFFHLFLFFFFGAAPFSLEIISLPSPRKTATKQVPPVGLLVPLVASERLACKVRRPASALFIFVVVVRPSFARPAAPPPVSLSLIFLFFHSHALLTLCTSKPGLTGATGTAGAPGAVGATGTTGPRGR